MDEWLKRNIKVAAVLAVIISAALVLMRQWRFAGGFLAGASWSIISFLLTVNLLKMAILQGTKRKLPLTLLIKFPLLYLTGYLLLVSKWFSVYSLLAGSVSMLLVTGGTGIWPKRT